LFSWVGETFFYLLYLSWQLVLQVVKLQHYGVVFVHILHQQITVYISVGLDEL